MQLLLRVCGFDLVAHLQQLLSTAVTGYFDVCNLVPNQATQATI